MILSHVVLLVFILSISRDASFGSLPFHPPVLEPDLNLPLRQVQSHRDLVPSQPGEIIAGHEFSLQFGYLLLGEGSSLLSVAVAGVVVIVLDFCPRRRGVDDFLLLLMLKIFGRRRQRTAMMGIIRLPLLIREEGGFGREKGWWRRRGGGCCWATTVANVKWNEYTQLLQHSTTNKWALITRLRQRWHNRLNQPRFLVILPGECIRWLESLMMTGILIIVRRIKREIIAFSSRSRDNRLMMMTAVVGGGCYCCCGEFVVAGIRGWRWWLFHIRWLRKELCVYRWWLFQLNFRCSTRLKLLRKEKKKNLFCSFLYFASLRTEGPTTITKDVPRH